MAEQEITEKIDLVETSARILQFLQTAQYAEAEKLAGWLITTGYAQSFEPNFYLGVALQFQGKVESALHVFNMAQQLDHHNINVMQAIASCLEQLNRHQEAYEQLLKTLAIAPEDPIVNANLGSILEKIAQPINALSYYDKALAIDAKNFTALMNRGALLSNMNKKLQALVHYRLAHQIHPQSIGILFNLVDTLLGVFKYDEALAYCDAGLAMQPAHAYLLFKKGLILSCLKHYDFAHQCLAEAQVIDPKVLLNALPNFPNKDPNVEISLNPVTLYLDAMYQAQEKCFWLYRQDYITTWQKIIVGERDENQVVRNLEFSFHILSLPINGQTRLKLAQDITEWIRDLTWLEGVPPFKYAAPKPNKIRLGYFSSDFRLHPTGLLSRQIFGLHNKDLFDVYIYSFFNNAKKDHVRLTVEQECTVFKDVTNLNDGQLACQINADQIDILIDLNGYTAKSRSKVMAMKPAPIQVSYLAYLQSMGADFIDYAILDNVVCPNEYTKDWQEKVARLPNSFYVYDTETSNVPIEKKRADYGLPDDKFVYCCLNTNYKIEPEIFTVWMNILLAVPNSVLWLVSNDELTISNLHREAAHRGVSKDCLIFAQSLPHSEHLLRYQLADLFIDTYWYGGHTTGLDALWQGLPVLCCIGEVPTSRVGASYQYVLEMPEMVAENFQEYQEKAVYYGTNPEASNALKLKLKEKKKTTPLFNTPLTVKHIEAAYQHMWQRYQDGLPPETFDVPDLSQTIN